MGTVYKDNYKVLREFSSATVQELELQKSCLDLRCPKGTEQVLLIPCRSGAHTACLMPGRQVHRQRQVTYLSICFFVEADSHNSHDSCYSINIYTHFGCSHKDTYAMNVGHGGSMTYIWTITYQDTSVFSKMRSSNFPERKQEENTF